MSKLLNNSSSTSDSHKYLDIIIEESKLLDVIIIFEQFELLLLSNEESVVQNVFLNLLINK